LDLFGPTENVAVVVLNRATGRAIQRIARADTVAGTTAIAHRTSSISVHTVWPVLVVSVYRPKNSAAALFLEGKKNLLRLQQDIPLTEAGQTPSRMV
jgi:hypothetical protein